MLGSGFVADFYVAGLRDVPGSRVSANYSRSESRAADFGRKYGVKKQYDSIEGVCADPEVQMVVIALPNHMHVEAARKAAGARKAIVCTKPLARNADEAAEMLRAVRAAGVMNGYAETEVFSPDVMRTRTMIESGAVGDVLTIRSREGHPGPHAGHFLDRDPAGVGALLGTGGHTIQAP